MRAGRAGSGRPAAQHLICGALLRRELPTRQRAGPGRAVNDCEQVGGFGTVALSDRREILCSSVTAVQGSQHRFSVAELE